MRSDKKILLAFILNFSFSIFEFIGGAITGSVAIFSDAVHDIGDATTIGLSYFLERKSKKQPDDTYTYGYARYSVIGSVITTLILLLGSMMVIINSINRIINPVKINYNGMIVLALIGVLVNFCAAWFTREGDSLNEKAVNLHMLEDVLGWVVVLIGAIVMRFTDISIIDPIMSIGVALFIFVNSFKNFKEILDLFLDKVPHDIDINVLKEHILKIDGVQNVHHVHIWSIDGRKNFATMHIVTDEDGHDIKEKIRAELREHNIFHVTLELETSTEHCDEETCCIEYDGHNLHHHHHHHH